MEKKMSIWTEKRGKSSFGLMTAGMLAAGLTAASMFAPMSAIAEEAEAETEVETETTFVTQMENRETSGITISTDYPGITMKPGSTSTFQLYVTNAGEQEAAASLVAEDLPEGWQGVFKGGSNEVSMIHIAPMQTKEDSPSLSYSLTIPEDTPEDLYTITLSAQGEDVNAELPLQINVDAEEKHIGAGDFTTDYTDQEGTSGTKFSYSTTLTNNSDEDQTYSLTAEGLPEGWNVTFTPSGAGATSSVPVAAGGNVALTVAVVPAQNVMAGEYPITLTAVSAKETLELPVNIKITGSYGLRATTPTGNLSAKAYAGETQDVVLTLQNTGNIDLTAVSLSAQASTDWEVTFDQDVIDAIPAGESADVTAHIKPAKDAILGDYVTVITASNDAVSSECDLRISVQNHTSWGIVAVGIIVVLVLGLFAIIRKFGRR